MTLNVIRKLSSFANTRFLQTLITETVVLNGNEHFFTTLNLSSFIFSAGFIFINAV